MRRTDTSEAVLLLQQHKTAALVNASRRPSRLFSFRCSRLGDLVSGNGVVPNPALRRRSPLEDTCTGKLGNESPATRGALQTEGRLRRCRWLSVSDFVNCIKQSLLLRRGVQAKARQAPTVNGAVFLCAPCMYSLASSLTIMPLTLVCEGSFSSVAS